MLEGGNARLSREERIKRLQALAGQYIALAHAVQPAKEVYLASLRRSEVHLYAVERFLLGTCSTLPVQAAKSMPPGALRAGYLTAPDVVGSCVERWARRWVVLDTTSLRTATAPADAPPGRTPQTQHPEHRFALVCDVRDARRCADPSLPKGAALWVALKGRPQGLYLVADSEDDAEAWTDALHVIAHVAAKGNLAELDRVLGPAGV